jgi:phosphatidylglycerol:prolipoprotein diacylglycerol transferase
MGRFWYAGFMLLALVVFVMTRHFIPRPAALMQLPRWKGLVLGLAAFVGGSLGAKLPFALASPGDAWLDGTAWLSDGKTIVAGLIGAYLAVELAKWALDIHVKTGDTFALPLALALAVGRFGCFFNGCCYGTPTSLPWGISFRMPDGQWLRCHPTQLYEVLFHSLMAVVLIILMRRGTLRGQLLKLYLISYGCFRFLTEYIRPEPIWLAGLTFYQWASLVLILGLLLQWLQEVHAHPHSLSADVSP